MIKQLFFLLIFTTCLVPPIKAQHKQIEEHSKRQEIVKKEVGQKNREKVLLEKISKFPEGKPSPDKLASYYQLAQFYRSVKNDSLKLDALHSIIDLGNRKSDFDIIQKAMTMEMYHYVMKSENDIAAKKGEAIFDLASENNNQEFQFQALTALAGIYSDYDVKKHTATIDLAMKLAITDYQKAFAYLNKASNIKSINLDSSEYYFNLAKHHAFRSKDSVRISATQRDYGLFLGSQQRTFESLTELHRGLEFVPKKKLYNFNRLSIIKSISVCYRSLEDYKKAEDYILQAIKIAETEKYTRTINELNRVYGEILLAQNKLDEAYEKLHTAYTYYQESKNQAQTLSSGSNLGYCLVLQGNSHKAQFLYDSLNTVEFSKTDFGGPYQRYLRLGYSLDEHNGNYKDAIEKMETSLMVLNRLNLGKEKIEILKTLAQAHKKKGNLDKSNHYYQEAFLLRDSLFNSELINTSKGLEAKYEAKQKEKEISFLNQDNLLKSKMLNQRTWALTIGGIALLVISLLLFYLFYFYRKIQNQNQTVKKALEEKDYLLREIHHRVKNNLQVVSSLLSLQSRQIEDEDIRKAIDEGRNRVRSMALIHQNLYQNDSLSGVSVTGYLDNLIKELFDTYNITSENIILDLEIEEIALDIDTMVPLGLIINELISNCLKHAFPENGKGHISVKLLEHKDEIHLMVKDNGVGLDHTKMTQSKSFGKKLINAFSKKLNAEMTTVNNNGTEVSLIIKNYKKAA